MMRKQRDFPRQLNIGDSIWEVRFCRKIPDYSQSILGLCDPETHIIWVVQKQSAEERFKTFIHEVNSRARI